MSTQETVEKADAKDLNRGKILLVFIIILFVFLCWIYIDAHRKYPGGLFSAKAARLGLMTVGEANSVLAMASQDMLEPEAIATLTRSSDKLGLLAPQLGAEAEFTVILGQIKEELGSTEVHWAALSRLFGQIEDRIEAGSGTFFWSGSADRWIELAFFTVIGTLAFLLNEIKTYFSQPYLNKRNFIIYTPWYAVNFIRGPFIALVILLALTSISFEAIGITVDIKSAQFEYLILLAAVLGYKSRVADNQLDILTEKLLPDAWKKMKQP